MLNFHTGTKTHSETDVLQGLSVHTAAEEPDIRRISDPDPGTVTAVDIARFLRKWATVIAGCAAIAALGTGIKLVSAPSVYEATATLMVTPPTFTSPLKSNTLSVQAYQKILESDQILATTREQLLAKGVLKPEQDLILGEQITTAIFVSKRDDSAVAPMIRITSKSDDANHAAETANTMAQIFLTRMRDLTDGTTTSTISVVENQYRQAKESLSNLENQRLDTADKLVQTFNIAATRWESELTRSKLDGAKKVSDYRAETVKMIENFSSEHSLELHKQQLLSLIKIAGELKTEEANTATGLQQRQLQYDSIKEQMSGAAEFLTLRKAITDEALWTKMALSKNDPNWADIKDRTLITQQINPLFTSLADRRSQAETELKSMIPQVQQIRARLNELETEIKATDTVIRTDNIALDQLQRARETGLAKVQADSDNALASATRQRDEELDALKRQELTRLGQLDRSILQARDLFTELAKNFNQGQVAKSQELQDVRLALPAAKPERAASKHLSSRIAIAGVVGALLAAAILWASTMFVRLSRAPH